ncbi:MAG: hypothetical protein F9B45_10435 [Phycisphaera sp. RhM]|nr:hypothetical protein [Phycisphaera sp. RhM]
MNYQQTALSAFLFAAAIFGGTNPEASAATTATPNLVIIFADDLGYGDVSCYGATKISTRS